MIDDNLTHIGVREVRAYIESCAPEDEVASPSHTHYCLAAQTLRRLCGITHADELSVYVDYRNTCGKVRDATVEFSTELTALLDAFDDIEWWEHLPVVWHRDPVSYEDDILDKSPWVTRQQLEDSGILPWLPAKGGSVV